METAQRQSIWDRVLLVVVTAVAVYAFLLVVAGLWLGETVFEWLGLGLNDGNIESAQREYAQLLFGNVAFAIGLAVPLAAIKRDLA